MILREQIEGRILSFRNAMKREGFPITPQKLSIFQFLASTESHPTAQEVYEKMRYYFENISFATVYKNLKKFESLGLVKEIPFKGNTARYDAGMDPHHHLINLDTNEIIDVSESSMAAVEIPPIVAQFDLAEVSVNFFVRNKNLSRYEQLKKEHHFDG